MEKKGFATIIILIIFIVLSLIVLIIVQRQHTNIDAATQAKFKATSKIAAESAAQRVINFISSNTIINGTTAITVGDVSITAPNGIGACSPATEATATFDGNVVVFPQNALCLIDTNTYSLRVIGYESANKMVKTEVSVGFQKQ